MSSREREQPLAVASVAPSGVSEGSSSASVPLQREFEDARRMLDTVQRAQSMFISGADTRAVFETLLHSVVAITQSAFGFIGEVRSASDGAPYLVTRAMTDITFTDEARALLASRGPEAFEFRRLDSLYGVVLRTGEALITNSAATDPRRAGVPERHPPLVSFAGLPLRHGGRVVGMLGLANRPGGYDAAMVASLEPLLSATAVIVSALGERSRRQATEARFRAMIERSSEYTMVFDREQRITYASPAVLRFMPDAIGQRLPPAHPDDAAVRAALWAQSAEQPGVAITSPVLRVRAADGSYTEFEGTLINLLDDPAVGGYVLNTRNVSERCRAERDRARLQAQVQHAQKLESLGVLAGGIAHDFNNLLVAILGNVALARMELDENHPAHEVLRDAEVASQRAADLCRQMLAYSGRGRFVVETIDLSALVKEMTNLLFVSISKKVALKLTLAKDLPLIEVEPSQVRQIVMNLVTNAAEAIADQSGVVTITTGAMQCDHAYLRESYLDDDLPSGVYVYVEVADTGIGMDAATRERIFDPFFTTKFTGRGLGLASVLGIVRGHKGAIKVYSEPGRGSTIKALFPAHEGRASLPGERAAEVAVQGTGLVLIVDDEESVRTTARRILERAGFEVLTAPDGRAALPVFREHVDTIGVVLLDMTMPHLDGPETYRELRRIRADVRVVLTSGYSEQDAVSKFAGKGLAGFVQKPFRMQDLADAIRKAMPPRA